MQEPLERRRALTARVRTCLLVLTLLASGCASSSRLPWNETRMRSIKLPRPSQSYAPDGKRGGRLPGRELKLPSHQFTRPNNDFGVGDGPPSRFHLPFQKPKTLESYKRTSPFDL